MQYTVDGENGDRSSEGDDDHGLPSNPLAHPFSNTLYNYGQHTSLPQPWQEASGLAISYPGYNGGGGGGPMIMQEDDNRGSNGMYAHEDVLEREIALLEEEDPTLFLDGLVEPTAHEEPTIDMRTENPTRPSTSSNRLHSQQHSVPNTIPGLSQIRATPHQPSQPLRAQHHHNVNQNQSHNHTNLQNQSQIQIQTQAQNENQTQSYNQSQQHQQHHHHLHGYQPASLSSISGAKDRSLDQLLISFWTHQMDLAEKGTAANAAAGSSEGHEPHEEQDEFKTFGLPLARIKKVMKSDPEVKMISAEVPVLLSKACEIFIAELTCRAWLVAESHKRRTLQKSDVASAIGFSDMFDFLIDIVPREEAISKSELGMKRRTARMKEKKEEERKRKRQEELEDAFAHSQVQARNQTSGPNPRPIINTGSAPEITHAPAHQGQSLRPNQSSSSGIVTPSIQQHRTMLNSQREEGIPPEKRRREE